MTSGLHTRSSALLVLAVGIALGLTAFLGRGSPSGALPSSPRATATTFARDYLRVLTGTLSPGALPDATPRVRGIAASAQASAPGRVSASAVLGAVALRYVSGAPTAQAVVEARDGSRRLPFDLGLVFTAGHWEVGYLAAPDIGTALAPPRRAAAVPSGIRRAAARFALGYADYRAGVTPAVPAALSAMRAQITSGRSPLAGLARNRATLRSLDVGAQQGDLIAVTATIQDGHARPRFSFVMQRAASGDWLAWQFPQEGTG